MKRILFILLSIQFLFATSDQTLISGKAIEGTIKHKEKQYYSITVPKNKSLRVNLTELEADVDLYVKKGNEVRVRFNDCYSSNSRTENEECLITNKGQTALYTILVNGFKASTYNLKATIEEAEKIPTLGATPIEDFVEQKEGKQYQLSGTKGKAIKITLSDLTADADLRVRVGRKANLHSFDCKSTNGGTKIDECVITPKKDVTVYVHVYGYKDAKYSINALQGTFTNPCISLNKLKTKIKNNEDVTELNTSCITDMSNLFKGQFYFNQDISSWDVSNVTNMYGMFYDASSFNQPIGKWNVSKVKDMGHMFMFAKAFNQDISKWNVSNVIEMGSMFSQALTFNQYIGDWNVSNVKRMDYMFENTASFNQDISKWDVSNVTVIGRMFEDTKAFNQYIGDWDVSNVVNMSRMFAGAKVFNQDISKWDVSNVTDMHTMFAGNTICLDFNQDISSWDVSKVTNMSYMFNQNCPNGYNFKNHDLSKWNVGKVIEHRYFFNEDNTNNIEPKWIDDNKSSELISLAKRLCLTNNTITNDKVLCSSNENKVYILESDKDFAEETVTTISTEGDWSVVNKIKLNNDGYLDTSTLNGLKNTNLFYVKSRTSRNSYFNFYYFVKNNIKKVLRVEIQTDDHKIDSLKTTSNGGKLEIEYHHEGSGQKTIKIYDIRNLPKIILL